MGICTSCEVDTCSHIDHYPCYYSQHCHTTPYITPNTSINQYNNNQQTTNPYTRPPPQNPEYSGNNSTYIM